MAAKSGELQLGSRESCSDIPVRELTAVDPPIVAFARYGGRSVVARPTCLKQWGLSGRWCLGLCRLIQVGSF